MKSMKIVSLLFYHLVCFLQIDGITDREFTANEILGQTAHLAKCMREKLNVKSGDTIGICSENRIEFVVTAFATIALGATLAPFNTTYTEGIFNIYV